MTFTDPDSGKKWFLQTGVQNYLERFIGFCHTCETSLTQYYEIDYPDIKKPMKVNCQICNPREDYPYNRRSRKVYDADD